MDLGYARVSTTHQDLTRQLDALRAAGIPDDRIYVDKKTGANVDREGLRALLDFARDGDTIVLVTLDRLGRTVRDTLNVIHDLTARGIGVRTLRDAVPIDTTDGDSPMARLAVLLLALFAEMERVYMLERAASARAAAAARGRQVGRPSVVDPDKLAFAVHLRDVQQAPMAEIVRKTGLSRATLYRHLPARPEVVPTASGTVPAER
ncbi:MAG TPA: resolvase [Micrococcales bacterium]|uniref:recombinase family protein n=1 Tax=Miniimonas arenae TaxID=676201 RepID=UPI000EE2B448|nr:recombinase family protein [Miniimonas arenae]HCX86207.1 resolvase [Micrococcales bacterium]